MRQHLSVDQLHFVGAVAEAAADHDYDILLSPSGPGRDGAFERMLGERRVDGVIVMETLLHDSRVSALIERNFPFVTIGRTGAEREHGWVDLDYAGLVTRGVEKLHALGHRDIALVNRPQELLDREYGPAFRAAEAFDKAVVELELDGVAWCCDDDDEAAPACVDSIFAAAPAVTAILTINERSLTGVVTALLERGRRVPQDVSVLAIASARNATSLRPMVSAAEVPTEQMGRNAVEALLRRLADPDGEFAHVLLSPPFVDRESLAAPSRHD
jgi:DNA-binding LacI/PurR family transcriptional regulator